VINVQNKHILKILAILILLVLVVSCATLSIAVDNNVTNTIYVPDDYAKIQWAVDNATAGDTIIVRDGTYTENIVVNKRCLTIKSENGYATVQAANTSDSVFEVTADYVNISGFTAKNSFSCAGISLNDVVHCNISYNKVSKNYRGIDFSSGNFNLIADNIITDNKGEAICLYYGSNYNRIEDNKISNNTWGVWIGYYGSSSHNIVSCNNITGTKQYGAINVCGNATSNNTIINNTVLNNRFGISLEKSNNNTVMNNIASNNTLAGIALYYSSNNTVEENNVSNNYGGIGFSGIRLPSDSNSIKKMHLLSFSYENLIKALKSSQVVKAANLSARVNRAKSRDLFTSAIELNKKIAFYPSNGIYLSSSNNNTIKNNTANSNNGSGISLYNSSSNNIVINNTANFNICDGIDIQDSSDYNNIIDNNVRFNKFFGVFLRSSNHNTITDNYASSNGAGISLGDLSSNNTVNNNTVNSNLLGGIDIGNSSDNNTINNNTASFNGGWGISLYSSDYNNIVGNYANSNNLTGILLYTLSSNNTIKNNTASSNEYFGILLDSCDNNAITGNYANSTENGTGILLYNLSSNNTIKNNTANSNRYDGIGIWKSSDHNTISNNAASFNDDFGTLLVSSNYNNVTNNDLFSNSCGLGLMELEFGGNTNNNKIKDNTLNSNKYCGISLLDIQHSNNITNNKALNNTLFGIFVYNSTNQTIYNNTVNSNERGIGLHESSRIQLINNTASANKISGLSLINSNSNTIFNNSACSNIYEGIFLSNSTSNNIFNNTVSSNYFGISLYSSIDNKNISNNSAESNYYFEVLLYNSSGYDTDNKSWHNQEAPVYGVSLRVLEALTPSLQTVENGTTASYDIVAENLGNSPDTYDLVNSSADNPEMSLNTYNVSLGAGEISINTTITEVESPQTKIKLVTPSVKTITLNVSATTPGIYTVKVKINSRRDKTVKDAIETRTIVTGIINSPIDDNETIIRSAIINSSINNSIINKSAIINSSINNSNIEDSIIYNSTVVGTNLSDVMLEDAFVNKGNISIGNITINETRYEISNETRISDFRTDYQDSDLVGIKNKTLNVEAKNSSISFDIRAKKDYFAGSMRVQNSTIPPDGTPEFTNNVVSYVYTNVSENLNNSTDWVIIKVFYDQDELDELRYFNKSAAKWEKIEINFIENYFWGNISHFSVFALLAQPPAPSGPKTALGTGGRGGRIRHLPEEITILIANLGINIFNFEWLGHDITKISIDLKSVIINAKVALKKVDKPVEFPDPPGIVYGYFDISTNIEPEKIRASKIHFKILKSWTVVNDVNAETIKLWRYVNGWEELETAKIKEDDNYLHFYAETKGFSLIAITSEKKALDVTPTAPAPTPPSESPVPSPPVHPAPVSLTAKLIIIVAIVASAISVSVTYVVLRRRKT
jgi:PGF-pre-PGF domain-containing protein